MFYRYILGRLGVNFGVGVVNLCSLFLNVPETFPFEKTFRGLQTYLPPESDLETSVISIISA